MSSRSDVRGRWRELVAEQATSGLSIAEFCRRREVAQASFYQWRKKLKASPASEPTFVPLSVVGGAEASVRFPCGAVLRLPAGDERTLAQVVSLLLTAAQEQR